MASFFADLRFYPEMDGEAVRVNTGAITDVTAQGPG